MANLLFPNTGMVFPALIISPGRARTVFEGWDLTADRGNLCKWGRGNYVSGGLARGKNNAGALSSRWMVPGRAWGWRAVYPAVSLEVTG